MMHGGYRQRFCKRPRGDFAHRRSIRLKAVGSIISQLLIKYPAFVSFGSFGWVNGKSVPLRQPATHISFE